MKKTLGPAIIGLLLALAATALPAGAAASRLRVLTINAWSGLDYVGSGSFGEYEPKERRERRHAGSSRESGPWTRTSSSSRR